MPTPRHPQNISKTEYRLQELVIIKSVKLKNVKLSGRRKILNHQTMKLKILKLVNKRCVICSMPGQKIM